MFIKNTLIVTPSDVLPLCSQQLHVLKDLSLNYQSGQMDVACC